MLVASVLEFVGHGIAVSGYCSYWLSIAVTDLVIAVTEYAVTEWVIAVTVYSIAIPDWVIPDTD